MSALAALCDALIPQDGPDDPGGARYRVDIAGEIDRRVAGGNGNGWRYAEQPTDGEAYRRGLAALDDVAGGSFKGLSRGPTGWASWSPSGPATAKVRRGGRGG